MKEGWTVKNLGDVFTFRQGIQRGIKLQSETKSLGQVRFLRIVDYTQGNELPRYIDNPGEQYLLNEKDISLVRYGASTGFVCKGYEGALANNLFRLIPNSPFNVISEYLYYFLLSPLFQGHIKKTMSGAAMPAINFGMIKHIAFPLIEIDEQQQIVVLLDQAFKAIDEAKANIEKNIANAKELFESKKEELFKKLHVECELKPIIEICEKMFAGGDKPKPNFSKFETDKYKIPVISNGEKNNGLFGFTNQAKVTEPSITISARGTIGFTVFRDYPFVPIVRLIVLTPKLDLVIPEFLMHAIKSLDILRTGSSIPQLTVPMMKGYSLPIPNKAKQIEIVGQLNAMESKLQFYRIKLERKMDELEELKKSILQKAFAGELTNKTVAV